MTTEQKEGSIPLRERRSLAEEWDEFARTIIPKEAPPVQLVECRRAFYAGAASWHSLLERGLDEGSEPTELDLAYLASLEQELETFLADIKRGKA